MGTTRAIQQKKDRRNRITGSRNSFSDHQIGSGRTTQNRDPIRSIWNTNIDSPIPNLSPIDLKYSSVARNHNETPIFCSYASPTIPDLVISLLKCGIISQHNHSNVVLVNLKCLLNSKSCIFKQMLSNQY